MPSLKSQCKIGFVKAEPVDDAYWQRYQQWIAAGRHGTMQYCEKYGDVRRDPRLLLDGASTVACIAFPYYTGNWHPFISCYALGHDYHHVLKKRMEAIAAELRERYGGDTRCVVDTAPMLERYWAVKAGLGFQGRNGMLIIPGMGSYFFLGEIIMTAEVAPSQPCLGHCGDCGACQRACPNGAILGDGTIDARRCISYLTIEHKGEMPDDAKLQGSAYGCDICQKACPHNADAAITDISEFLPRPEIMALDTEAVMTMTGNQYRRLVATSAMSRVPLARLRENINRMQP